MHWLKVYLGRKDTDGIVEGCPKDSKRSEVNSLVEMHSIEFSLEG